MNNIDKMGEIKKGDYLKLTFDKTDIVFDTEKNKPFIKGFGEKLYLNDDDFIKTESEWIDNKDLKNIANNKSNKIMLYIKLNNEHILKKEQPGLGINHEETLDANCFAGELASFMSKKNYEETLERIYQDIDVLSEDEANERDDDEYLDGISDDCYYRGDVFKNISIDENGQPDL